MQLVGAAGQRVATRFFDASGSIVTGGTAQLLIPQAAQRSSFLFVNTSDTDMILEFGSGRATATLSSGTVASAAVTNAGFGFSKPPIVTFLGGGYSQNATSPTSTIQGCPCWPAPAKPATAHCVMSGSAPNQTIGSIVIDDPGAGYAYPPYVLLTNDPFDPYGCAVPSATVGIKVTASGSYSVNGLTCTTDQISVFCATISKTFSFKYTV